jgi:hypothetical protein
LLQLMLPRLSANHHILDGDQFRLLDRSPMNLSTMGLGFERHAM